MGTGEFDFSVNTVDGGKQIISVKNAQCEIDGGFENDKECHNIGSKECSTRRFSH